MEARPMRLFFFLSVVVLLPGPVNAYVGPGLGAGAIISVLAVIGAILLAVFSVVYYPIKRALRKWRDARYGKPIAVDKSADVDG
jgi:hypothetical protein